MNIAVSVISGGAAALLLMGAAMMGGPKWGIVPVLLVMAGWFAVEILAGMTQLEMLIALIVATAMTGIAVWKPGR